MQGYLRDEDQTPAAPYRFAYRFARDGVRLTAEVAAGEAELLLPLTDSAAVQGAEKGRPVFSLAGGFAMTEYRAMVRAGTPRDRLHRLRVGLCFGQEVRPQIPAAVV